MSEADGTRTPRLTHFAINTENVQQTQAFYQSVFGWHFREYGPGGFVQILDEPDGTPMGAIQERRSLHPDTPTVGFECTIGVDSVDAIRERVIAADGRILMDKTTIPNVGHLLAFEDPGGNPVLAMEYDRPAA